MLAIRMQRTGRRGSAAFRVIVQDSRLSPKSGKVVERLGSYDPHSKNVILAKDRAEHFLTHGAQPSPRVAQLLKDQGIKLPSWVKLADKKESAIKNPDKLRKNRPAEEAAPVAEETTADAPSAEEAPAAETPAEPTEEVAAEEAPAEVAAPEEAPAKEESAEQA